MLNSSSLFLAGVPKSGTSALMNWLGQHPGVTISRPKEPNYFNSDLPLGLCEDAASYLSHFRRRSGARGDGHHEGAGVGVGAAHNERSPQRPVRSPVRCDGSVLYCYSEVAARRIAEDCAGARVVIVVRDPVEVMHAWHGQMRYTGNEPIADFVAALRAEPRRAAGSTHGLVGLAARCPRLLCYRQLVRFAEQIERFRDALGPDAVLVLTHEDLVAAPQASYAKVLRHAGLDSSWSSSHRIDFRRMNEFKVRRWMPLHRAIKQCAATPTRQLLAPAFRQRLIRGWDRLTSVAANRRPPLDPEVRCWLTAELRPQVERLAALLGRDLSHWWSRPRDHAASSVSEADT